MCLIFSVLSTIDEYSEFANETLFWMVSQSNHSLDLLCMKPAVLYIHYITFNHFSPIIASYLFFLSGNMFGIFFRRGIYGAIMECRMQVEIYGMLRTNAVYSETNMYNRSVVTTIK